MAYYVRYTRTDKVIGPFKTIAEARKKTIMGRFDDRADVYDGDARNLMAMVGQGMREYDGNRWITKYLDSKTGKYYYLNKDGTLSDTMDPRKGLTVKPNYKIWMDYGIIHGPRMGSRDDVLPIPLGWRLIYSRSLNELRAEIIRTIGATKRYGNVTARIEKPNGEYVGILHLNLSKAIDRDETYTWSNPLAPPRFTPDRRSVDPATGKVYGINHESDKYRRKDLKSDHAYVDMRAVRSKPKRRLRSRTQTPYTPHPIPKPRSRPQYQSETPVLAYTS